MPFPVLGQYAQMQSNMAATLNIDGLLDPARNLPAAEGMAGSPADLIRRLNEPVLQGKPVALEYRMVRADVVSLHTRLTAETTAFIGQCALARVKSGALLINAAHGPLGDYQAHYDTLGSGRLRGAVLDSSTVAPAPPESPLQMPNVTLTAHRSVHTVTAAADQAADVHRFSCTRPAAQSVLKTNGISI